MQILLFCFLFHPKACWVYDIAKHVSNFVMKGALDRKKNTGRKSRVLFPAVCFPPDMMMILNTIFFIAFHVTEMVKIQVKDQYRL